MDFEGYLEVNTVLGWEDISDRLIGFDNISESPRDKRTGKVAASSFNVMVSNEDGYWFAPEEYNALGKRMNDGEDNYVKTLRHRRVRVGIYLNVAGQTIKLPWATGRIVGFGAKTDDLTVTLKCETLEAEAMDTRCDVKSGEDSVTGEDYGIRKHRIDYDGDFEDDFEIDERAPYALYKRKETYEDSDDYSTALECHLATRINDVIDHIRNVLDIADEESNIDEVLRKAYYEDAGTGELIPRRACDQVKVLDNSHFGDANEMTFILLMADKDGNICMLHENDEPIGGTCSPDKNTYLSYYNYHTNQWMKWGTITKSKFVEVDDCPNWGQDRTAVRLGWYNEYTGTFQWVAMKTNPQHLFIYEWDPANPTVFNTADVESYVDTVSGVLNSNPNPLCFAQTTGANGGVGSLFVSTSFTISPPASNEIYELDISNIAGGLGVHAGPITDPLVGGGEGPGFTPGVENFIAWGDVVDQMVVTAAAVYDSVLDPDMDGVYGDGIGTCQTQPARGLVARVDRSNASPGTYPKGQFYGAVWIDLYGDHPNGPGTGVAIWVDTTKTDDVNQGQTIFKVIDPDGNHQTVLPLQEISPAGSYTFVAFPDMAWGTDNPSASGAVSPNGETKHAYYDPNGGPGTLVQREYEDLETGDTERWPRFYFWANQYYGANGPGKLQSTDGKTLRAENTSVQESRYGDRMFGDFQNCLVATGLAFTRGRDGRLIVTGGFYKSDDTPDTNYIFVYGWDIQWTLPVLDVRDLTIADLLSYMAQLAGYEWWFGARGELNFIDRGFEIARPEWTLERIDNVELVSKGFDYKELVNYVKITPYEVAYQDSALGGAVQSECFYSQQAGALRLNWIRISPTNTSHKKIKVQINNVGLRQYTVQEWDDGTNDWGSDLTGGGHRYTSAWTDPNGEYTIPAYPDGWEEHGAPVLDDYWLFWTVEPLWGL